MKKILMAALAMALSLPAIALAQNAQNSGQQQDDKTTQQEHNQAAEINQMGSSTLPQQTMAGMVSDNGKTFTSNNKSYVVNNPKTLKGRDSQNVSIVFQFNTDRNSIHVISVSPAQ